MRDGTTCLSKASLLASPHRQQNLPSFTESGPYPSPALALLWLPSTLRRTSKLLTLAFKALYVCPASPTTTALTTP